MARPTPQTPLEQLGLDFATAQTALTKMRHEIDALDAAYHQRDTPTVPDAAYDDLTRQHDAILAAHPGASTPRKVGAAPAEGFRAVPHGAPMLSLDNGWTRDELASFIQATTPPNPDDGSLWLIQEKIDGLSVSITYTSGALTMALTRGDGREGEDVTANALTIASIPQRLPHGCPDHIEIRGECYMRRSDLAEANRRRIGQGKDAFATLRNAAAGSLRQTDPEETRARRLAFMAFGVGQSSQPLPETETALLALLQSWGFALPQTATARSLNEAYAHYSTFLDRRLERDHDIDGTVVKVDNRLAQKRLGTTGRYPRWAIAMKFPAERVTTTLQAISLSVGRSGTLTPVAELTPTRVGGVEVSRATLHNADHIASLDLRPGDLVELERAGDVIPRVTRSLGAAPGAPRAATPWSFPTACPACSGPVARDPDGAHTRCISAMACPGTALARFDHLASRDVLDLSGLGEGKVQSLLDLGLLTTPADLYRLHQHRHTIARADGWGETSVDALLASIEQRRTLPLDRVILSLGIREIGRSASRAIAAHFGPSDATFSHLRTSATDRRAETDLQAIEGIGPIMAAEIACWFRSPNNLAALTDLLQEITIMEPAHPSATTTSPIAGKIIVFTGALTLSSRDEAENQARTLGAKPASSVSAQTNILVVGERAGSKLKKAQALIASGKPIEILDEQDWQRLAQVASH